MRFEPHSHSHYSNIRLIDSINKPKDMILTAAKLGYAGIALTDHEALCGHVEWLELEKELKENKKIPENFKCALGNEIYLINERGQKQTYWHYLLIAKNDDGHRALRELSSNAWLNSYTDRRMERVPTTKKELEAIVKKYPNSLVVDSACFVKETPVLTKNGTKNINDITTNDYILNQFGQWEKVNFPTSRFYIGEGKKISFFEGIDSIRCTDNHKFLVTTNNWQHTDTPLRWIEAKDLNIKKGCQKHICVFPITPTYTNKNIIYRSEWENTLRKIKYTPKYLLPDEIILTPEIMRLFGLWLGDGSISIINRHKSISLSFSEEEYLYYWHDFVEKASQDLKITWSKTEKPNNHKIELSSSSIELLELFYYLFGLTHADTKYIPQRLKHISPELDWNLFVGYALADGYFRERAKGKYQLGEFVSASISKQLTLDMKELLQSLGIRSSFMIAPKRKGIDGVCHQTAYYLSSSNNAWKNFSKKEYNDNNKIQALLVTAQNHDRKKHFTYNGILYKKVYIKEIQSIQLEEQVYCLNVDSHSFCCNGVVVHNCLGSELDGLVLKLVDAEEKEDKESILNLKKEIDDFLKWNISLFGNDFYIEIAPGRSKDQKKFNKRIKSIANFYHRKIIIGTDAHYLTSEYREIHKAFLNSKDGEREVDSFYQDAHFMTDEEAFENLKDFFSEEEFQQMCENSLEVMNKIENYHLFHNSIIPEVEVHPAPPQVDESLKDYPTLYKLRESKNPQERQWVNECLKSLLEKKIDDEEHLKRLELEADIISYIGDKLGNCLYSYFNTFCHYINLFWECGSVVGPGRGSSGSFLSNYLLGITQLDPIEWNLPYFRFLNKERAELPDIDLDLAPSKRPIVLKKIREERGELNVAQVATFGTTSAKAAIATACRGYRSEECPKGIDVDIATYLSSLVPSERGMTWTLQECFEGNEEKDRKPIKELCNQFEQYPGLKEIALGIEDLIVRRGQHASGVILYNNSPYDTGALMRSPNGDITTQFDLHRAELLGDTKFDFLVTDICDKIGVCLQLLKENHYFDDCKNLREIYNKCLHPQVIDLHDQKMWKALEEGSVQDVFQFNTQIGIETAKAIKPRSPAEMTAANALMRLVAQEGEERPFDRYVRFKNNISLWYKEMDEFGLTKEEQKILEPYYKRDYGVPASQEQLMLMVMDKNISHFTLGESNHCRKVLAKKKVKEIPVIQEKFLSQCPSKNLGEYCWKTMMKPQMSYSFSEVHSLLYSFIGIQTLVLATKYPSVYWNTACLIVNAQSIEDQDIDEIEDESDSSAEENEEDEEQDENEKIVIVNGKKKKQKVVDYGRVASAIGKFKQLKIKISPPNINHSTFTFSPDEENNQILFGLSGITKIGTDLVKSLIENRPYSSINDILLKNKINKTQMINLIKCGALDEFGDRRDLMEKYVNLICGKKNKLTLQNMPTLITYGLIPSSMDNFRKLYNFNKYLKSFSEGDYYLLDARAIKYLNENTEIDDESFVKYSGNSEGILCKIEKKLWDKVYKKGMEPMRQFLKDDPSILESLNKTLFNEIWDKSCKGSISKWEMDSISFYSHQHELTKATIKHHFDNFFNIPEEPVVEKTLTIKGKQVPFYQLSRIAGTVLDKNKLKNLVTILTTNGVVNVKVWQNQFVLYDKQISVRDEITNKKKVIEKSWFSRGNKLIITGIRRGDTFIPKVYRNSPWRAPIELIDSINEETGDITTRSERLEI